MRIIRASEIGTYHFCQRAWWYQLQGYEADNKAEMAGGNQIHEQHARTVMLGNCLTLVAYTSLLLAVLGATIWVIQSLL